MLLRTSWIKYIINIDVHFVGDLNIMDCSYDIFGGVPLHSYYVAAYPEHYFVSFWPHVMTLWLLFASLHSEMCFDAMRLRTVVNRLRTVVNEGQNMTKLVKLISKLHAIAVWVKLRKVVVDCIWNVMAHTQKPDFVFWRNGQVRLNRQGRQFSRLLAAEVWASAAVMLDTPCSEVVWRVLATHSIRQFPLHFPSHVSLCAITFQVESTLLWLIFLGQGPWEANGSLTSQKIFQILWNLKVHYRIHPPLVHILNQLNPVQPPPPPRPILFFEDPFWYYHPIQA